MAKWHPLPIPRAVAPGLNYGVTTTREQREGTQRPSAPKLHFSDITSRGQPAKQFVAARERANKADFFWKEFIWVA